MPRVMGNHSSLTHIMEERPRYATPEGEISVLVHCQIRVSCSAVVGSCDCLLYLIQYRSMARVEEHVVLLYLPEETKCVYYNPNTWFWENSSINLMNVLNVTNNNASNAAMDE